MAGKAVDLVFRKLGKRPVPSRTETTPIHGGRIDSMEEFLGRAIRNRPNGLDEEVIRSLVHNHGSEYGKVVGMIEENPALGGKLGDAPVLKAEVVHAVRKEMARTLEDVVFRRTDLGTAEHPGEEALRTCAEIMASELGWGKERAEEELGKARSVFPRHGSSACNKGKERIRHAAS
jgi:glycerol-3-phosphate dehydrogenase